MSSSACRVVGDYGHCTTASANVSRQRTRKAKLDTGTRRVKQIKGGLIFERMFGILLKIGVKLFDDENSWMNKT